MEDQTESTTADTGQRLLSENLVDINTSRGPTFSPQRNSDLWKTEHTSVIKEKPTKHRKVPEKAQMQASTT